MARDAGGGRDLRPAKPAINYAESDGSTATPETSPGKSSFDESFGSSNTSLGMYDGNSSEVVGALESWRVDGIADKLCIIVLNDRRRDDVRA